MEENLVQYNLGISPEFDVKVKLLKNRLNCRDEGEVFLRGIIALEMCTQEGAQLLVPEENVDEAT